MWEKGTAAIALTVSLQAPEGMKNSSGIKQLVGVRRKTSKESRRTPKKAKGRRSH